MLELLTAVRFDRKMSNGRTGPLLLVAEDAEGREIEVVAKFSQGAGIGPAGLAREALCAMLAADLGLPVPRPYLVKVDAAFIESVRLSAPDVANFLAAGLSIGFGSRKLPPGYSAWMVNRPIPKDLIAAAAEIFAFDLLLQNTDRRPDNPNLESRGDSFAIFDHELALITEGVLFWKPPWEVGALTRAGSDGQHALLRGLKGRRPDLNRLIGAWEAISDQRLIEYRAALAVEWNGAGPAIDTAITFLRDLRDNLRPAMDEVVRVLS